MNNTRRKKLARIQEELRELQDRLQILINEEEDYRDDMPENLQGGEKYEQADTNCANMEYASDSIDECCDYIDECLN